MRKLFLLVVLFMAQYVLAQQDPTNYIRTDLIGPSPNAGSIARYGEVPLSLYTGLPNIAIPVHTVTSGSLSLPVSLTYNFDGFKPATPSSWVGMGWTLQAGGVITRQVRDKVDEEGTSAGTYDTITNILERAETDQTFLKNIVTNAFIDSEPDLFSFNFPGHSGKFVIVKGKIYLLPDQQLKITGNPSAGFTITTPEGVKYFFTVKEFTSPKGSPGASYNIPTYSSAWNLWKIENAAGTESIVLSYTDEGNISQTGVTSQTFKYVHPFQGENAGDYAQTSQVFQKKGTYPSVVSSLRLNSIYTNHCSVYFIAGDSARRDIDQYVSGNARPLSGINVVTGGETIKRFKLKQHYRESTGFNGRLLFLDSLYEYKTDGGITTLMPYGFEYNAVNNLQTKSDAAVDYYGYYLGNGDFGANILPEGQIPSAPVNPTNREPNGAAISGSLSRVAYPTGGHVSFEYEMNRRYDGNNYSQIADEVESEVSGTPVYNNTIVSPDSEHFTLHYPQTITVWLTRSVHSPFGDNNARNLHQDFIITEIDGDAILGPVARDSIVLESDNSGKAFHITLPAGTYYINTYIDYRETNMQATVIYYTNGAPLPGAPGAGIRVKQVTSDFGTGSPVVKKYYYTNEDGFSTGASNMVPLFQQREYTDEVAEVSIFRQIHSTIYTSSLTESIGIGIPHYYTSVVEEVYTPDEKLRVRHDFISFESEGNFMGVEPLAVTNYRQAGSEWEPINKTEYEYWEVTDTMIHAIKPYLRSKVIEAGGWYLPPSEKFDFEPYYLRKMWSALKSKKETIYTDQGTMADTTNYYYDINGSRNLKLVVTKDAKGNYFSRKIKYAQDYTSTLNNSFITAHVLSPVWEEQQWKKTSPTDSVLISGKIIDYNVHYLPDSIYAFEQATGVSALSNETQTSGKYNTLISDSHYQLKATFTYDANDRLLTQALTSGAPISYIWDYEGQYPIAEVSNAVHSDIAYTSFEADGGGNWTYTGLSVKDVTAPAGLWVSEFSADNISRSGLSAGKTYTLTYWLKSSTPLSISGSGGASISSPETVRTKKGWTLFKYTISNTTSITISGTGRIDEIKLYPAAALMKTYTYQPLVGMTSVTEVNGQTTYYEYDSFNRLQYVKDDEGKILKQACYNYAGQPHSCGIAYYSAVKSGNFTRNNCSSGYTGSTVTYTVPAGTYTSALSQAVADSLAQADVNANGQAYANTNGTCTQTAVYVKLTLENLNYQYGVDYYTFADVVVRFYSDSACTTPVNVSAMTVNYRMDSYCDGGLPYPDYTDSGYANAVSMLVLESQALIYSYSDEIECTFAYSLMTHSAYTIVP